LPFINVQVLNIQAVSKPEQKPIVNAQIACTKPIAETAAKKAWPLKYPKTLLRVVSKHEGPFPPANSWIWPVETGPAKSS
jgi:hypothetical protein